MSGKLNTSTESQALIKLGDATKLLAQVRDAPSAKKLMDLASAAEHYARKAKLGEESIASASAIKLDAERMLGRYLKATPDAPRGGRPDLGPASVPKSSVPTLASLGISKKLSSEAQRLAAIPDDDFAAVKASPSPAAAMRSLISATNRADRMDDLAKIAVGNAPLPIGSTAARYPVIYADPPWRYEFVQTESRAIENHYPTMALDEICGLAVGELATPDAILFLWATSPKLHEALAVVSAWGFTYRSSAVWVKDQIGMGYYFRHRHELLLVATRGSFPAPAPADRHDSVIEAPRGKHSEKPEVFAEVIERMYPKLPKVELFCRSPREGWSVWGNQS